MPSRHVVDPGDQRHERRLARAGGTDDRHGLTGVSGERDVLEDQPLRAGIAERDVPELDRATGLGEPHRILGGAYGRLGLEDLVEAAHAGRASLEQVDHPAQSDERPNEHGNVDPECHEFTECDLSGDDFKTTEPQYDDHGRSTEESEDWVEQACYLHEAHVSVHVLTVEAVELVGLALFLNVRSHDAHTRQVFLHHGRERGELLLNLLEALVNDTCECEHDRR